MSITYSNKLDNLSSQTARPFVQRLDTLGTGLGTTNAIGNYLATPTKFKLTPAAGELIVINEIHIYIEDDGDFAAARYGKDLVLVNGIRVETTQDLLVTGLTNNNVLTNAHWTRVTFESTVITYGAGSNALAFRWNIKESLLPLALAVGDELAFVLNDDFSALVAHSFSVRGFKFLF